MKMISPEGIITDGTPQEMAAYSVEYARLIALREAEAAPRWHGRPSGNWANWWKRDIDCGEPINTIYTTPNE